jgi:signal transduction histidine kinase
MRRRVLIAIMTVTTIVVILFALPLGFVLERLLDERAVFALEHRVDLAARNIDLTDTTDLPDASEFPNGPERFALYDPKGTRIFGEGPERIAVAKFDAASVQDRTTEIGPNLVTTLPVVSGETLLGYVRGQRSLATIDAATNRALALLTFGVLGVLIIGWLIARRLARTIAVSTHALRDAAVRLGTGDFLTAAPTTGIVELDEVSHALSATAHRLGELIDREQAFSADVSHQLRTPIAGLRTALETELAFPRDDHQTIVRESLEDVERFEQTVNYILAFARNERNAAATTVDVTDTVRNIHRRWSPKFVSVGRSLTLHSGTTELHAVGNQQLLSQALDALLDNAFKHGAGPTTLDVETDDSAITIQIRDSGSGTDNSATAGLGLALTRRLVNAQNGRLLIDLQQPNPTIRIVLLHAFY